MNIYDVAKAAGVSTATVSRYINKSGYVGKKTAAALDKIIAKEGYSPSAVAKTLSTGSTFKLIGIVCYNINDLYYAKSVSVLEKELKKCGYEIILSCTGESILSKESAIEMLVAKSVDAIIFIGSVFMDISDKILKNTAKKLPCFIINAKIDGDNIYSCYCDDRLAVKTAAEELQKSGCKKLLYLYDANNYGSERKRLGFLEAVKNGQCVNTPDTFDEILTAFPKIYDEHNPDGIICSNDMVAAVVLTYLINNGISVPEKVKLIGHNNSVITKCTSPPLTSIDNQVELLSELTAQNIVKLFNNEKIEKAIKIEHKIIKRGSF